MTITQISYEPNTPRPNQPFNSSQDELLDNFQFLYDAFKKNHVALDAATDAGNHNTIELAEQNTQFQTNAGEISVYAKKVEGQTDQLFMRYQGNQEEFMVSNYQIYPIPDVTNGSIVIQTTNITFLPGNMLIYFGWVSNPKFILSLNPFVTKNVVSAIFCGKDAAIQTPNISVRFNEKIIDGINIDQFARYYLVVANI